MSPPSPPPALGSAVSATLTFAGVNALTTTKQAALFTALRDAALPGVPASAASLTLVSQDVSYATTLTLKQLPYATWYANATKFTFAFTSALARDAGIDRFQAHFLAVRDGGYTGRRKLRQLAPVTVVDVRLDGFGSNTAAATTAQSALASAAASTSTSGSFIRASMRYLVGPSSTVTVATPLPAGTYSLTVQLGIGVLASASNAPNGAQIVANLAAALSSASKAAAIVTAVGGTGVTVGAPTAGSNSGIVIATPGAPGAATPAATPVTVTAAKKATPVAAGVGGGGFLLISILTACFCIRAMRRRTAAAAASANINAVMMSQQQYGQQPQYAPQQQQYVQPGGAQGYAPAGPVYYTAPGTYPAGQIYVNPLAEQPQPGYPARPLRMAAVAEFQADQRSRFPSPPVTPAFQPGQVPWTSQPRASQPRGSDPGMDFAMRQSRMSQASSGGDPIEGPRAI